MANRIIETEQEREAVDALATMALQYLTVKREDGKGEWLDSLCMCAGEQALKVLSDYGLVDAEHPYRIGEWTAFGERFLRDKA